MISEGIYRGRRSSHSWQVSPKKGTEYISIIFKLSDGQDYAGSRVEFKGWMTDKAMDRTLETLKLLGWDGVDIENLGPLANEVDLDIRHDDEGDYGIRERVAFVNEIGGSPGAKPMPPDRLKSLAARVKERQANPPGQAQRDAFAGAPAGDTFPSNGPDDDTPF